MRFIISNQADFTVPELANPYTERRLRKQITAQMKEAQAQAALLRDHQTQWGARPGVSTGYGRSEAVMPQSLYFAYLQKYPDMLTNDKTWNAVLRELDALKLKAY